MASSRPKAKGVSASSFFELKAEISKREDEVRKNKTGGGSNNVSGAKRINKKPTVWTRQNKGLQSRAARDVELEAIDKPTLESARSILERKAKIYEKLRKGKTGGLSDKQYDALLVDFDSKPSDRFESDSDDVDESLHVPRPPSHLEDDPMVEYEDEFGRVRLVHQSEVPRSLASAVENEPDEDEDIIIRNPVNYFPVYEPSAERIAEIAAAHSEDNNPLNVHYDASREVRAKGAGFYQFSGDEETRRAQMEELKAAREETSKVRQESGAVEVRPGEIEGMKDTGDGAGTSRAMEKRKRDLEERRKMIEAKRRKVNGNRAEEGEKSLPVSASQPAEETAHFVAHASTLPPPADPMSALEAKWQPQSKAKSCEMKKSKPSTEADVFLADLEQEFIGSRVK